MMKNAIILYRDGHVHVTRINSEHTPQSLAQRMTIGGFVICQDRRWGRKRTIVVNLSDVKSIVIEERWWHRFLG